MDEQKSSVLNEAEIPYGKITEQKHQELPTIVYLYLLSIIAKKGTSDGKAIVIIG